MAVTDWKLPGTAVGAGWTNPNNIKVVDANYAVKSVGAGGYSGVIRGENFGFTTSDIPAGSTIDGIEARGVIAQTGPADSESYSLYGQKVGGVNVGSNKASSWNFPSNTSVVTRTAGGATDTWGINPTAAEAIASTFAVAWEFRIPNAKIGGVGYIGSIELRFHFTPPAAPANPISKLLFAGRFVRGLFRSLGGF